MLSEWVEPKWQRPRGIRTVHVLAVLSALVAAGTVFGLFSSFSFIEAQGPGVADRQLVASVDLRIGNTVLAAQRGEAKAREDIKAGLLQLQTFDRDRPQTRAEAAKAKQLKQRYGITWLHKPEALTPVSQAFVDGYNRVVRAEIERRHGRDVLAQLPAREDNPTTEVRRP